MNSEKINQIGISKIDQEITTRVKLIMSMQSLPEEVVIRFIESKGALIRTKKGKLRIADKSK